MIPISASIGVSSYENRIQDPRGEQVIGRADTCLYVLKGKENDAQGTTEDRRGGIAYDSNVIPQETVAEWQAEMQRSGRRESMPPRS